MYNVCKQYLFVILATGEKIVKKNSRRKWFYMQTENRKFIRTTLIYDSG